MKHDEDEIQREKKRKKMASRLHDELLRCWKKETPRCQSRGRGEQQTEANKREEKRSE